MAFGASAPVCPAQGAPPSLSPGALASKWHQTAFRRARFSNSVRRRGASTPNAPCATETVFVVIAPERAARSALGEPLAGRRGIGSVRHTDLPARGASAGVAKRLRCRHPAARVGPSPVDVSLDPAAALPGGPPRGSAELSPRCPSACRPRLGVPARQPPGPGSSSPSPRPLGQSERQARPAGGSRRAGGTRRVGTAGHSSQEGRAGCQASRQGFRCASRTHAFEHCPFHQIPLLKCKCHIFTQSPVDGQTLRSSWLS